MQSRSDVGAQPGPPGAEFPGRTGEPTGFPQCFRKCVCSPQVKIRELKEAETRALFSWHLRLQNPAQNKSPRAIVCTFPLPNNLGLGIPWLFLLWLLLRLPHPHSSSGFGQSCNCPLWNCMKSCAGFLMWENVYWGG